MDTTEYMNGEQRPRRYFAHAQDDLNLHILFMFKGTFLLDAAHLFTVKQVLSMTVLFRSMFDFCLSLIFV